LFSQNRICKLCGLSKNTFKNHKHKDDKFQEKYAKLKKFVQKIIVKNSAYGVKRIKTALFEDYGIQVGRDALSRLLKIWGLQLRRKTQKHKSSIVQKILLSLADRTNLLIRTKVAKPFQALTSDFTAIHKDVFGQEVYGYNLSENMEANLVLNSFYKAKKKIKKLLGKIPDSILLHQDQGSQYTSYEYVDTVLKSKFTLSYSTPGTPTENPGQESFFGRFKDENKDEMIEIKSLRELERFIKNKINYYNKQRIHTSISYQKPEKFTRNFIKNLEKEKLKKPPISGENKKSKVKKLLKNISLFCLKNQFSYSRD
jgi:putative transposase